MLQVVSKDSLNLQLAAESVSCDFLLFKISFNVLSWMKIFWRILKQNFKLLSSKALFQSERNNGYI